MVNLSIQCNFSSNDIGNSEIFENSLSNLIFDLSSLQIAIFQYMSLLGSKRCVIQPTNRLRTEERSGYVPGVYSLSYVGLTLKTAIPPMKIDIM